LTRLSPSITDTSRRGTPSRRAICVPATGSVGPTIAPSVNATAQLTPGISAWATAATATIVASTSPIDSSVIGRRFARRSLRFAKNAPE
jgi:hypothetical protein